MDILQQKLIKTCSRDIQICQKVLGSGPTTPPGVKVRRTTFRVYMAGPKGNSSTTENNKQNRGNQRMEPTNGTLRVIHPEDTK